jgi:hypothetical protein
MTVVGHGKVGRVSRRSARFIDHLVPSGEGLRSENMKKVIGYREGRRLRIEKFLLPSDPIP